MPLSLSALPSTPALARVRVGEGDRLALWLDSALHDLSAAPDSRLHSLDRLLALPREQIQRSLTDPALRSLPVLGPTGLEVLPPVESQEVWAAGVTYLRSREARMEEAAAGDVYARVYEAERPELFFKCAGWRVVPSGGLIGVRPDSTWDVPEPELAVLSNAYGEVVAYSCGNDMSSRSIEGENPLYLPQAKVYEASCSLGPVAALAWHVQPEEIHMTIEREGREVFSGSARLSDLVRDPADLVRVLRAVYPLPTGAWLLTGTSIVPPSSYTAEPGDLIYISIDELGTLCNEVRRIVHSGAKAPAHLADHLP